MSSKYCPQCGKELPGDANFCLQCGAPVAMSFMVARSSLVTAGGILVIVAAAISAIDGFFALSMSISVLSSPYPYAYYGGMLAFYNALLVVGSFDIIGFVGGLTAGIQSVLGKRFIVAIAGAVLLMVSGIWNFLMAFTPYAGVFWAVIFGIPIIILDSIGLVFVASKKRQFTRAQRAPSRSVVIP